MDNNNSDKTDEKKSVNEERIRSITLAYYSRLDIRKAMFEFSQNRECIPRYFEGFGKRPDSFQYDSDILTFIQKGATSFHCSEELWKDPLEISTDLKDSEIKELRTGWDLLLDIDSPYLEYSKIFADLLIESLKIHGIKNVGVKFSVSGDTDILIKKNKEIGLIRIDNAIKLIREGEKLEVLSLNKNKKLQF